MIARRGHHSTKHLIYATGVARGRAEFCQTTGAEMSTAAWVAMQKRTSMEWIVLVWPRTLEDPGVTADFHVAEVRLRGRHGPLRGQQGLPGEARAQIVFTNDPLFPEDTAKWLVRMQRDWLPLLVDLWPGDAR